MFSVGKASQTNSETKHLDAQGNPRAGKGANHIVSFLKRSSRCNILRIQKSNLNTSFPALAFHAMEKGSE